MKAWDKFTPTMASASMLINQRNELYNTIRDSPTMSANKVDKIAGRIARLTKEINRRRRIASKKESDQIQQDVKTYSRNYGRIAKKHKLSKRAVKYILKKCKNKKQ